MLKKDLERLVNTQKAEIARLNATIRDLETQRRPKPQPNLMDLAKHMARKYKSVTKVQSGKVYYFSSNTKTWELAL